MITRNSTVATLLFVLSSLTAIAQLQVAQGETYITEKGKPFFWLGDTDWELVHRLTREEIDEVVSVRAEQGFNILHVVALAEMNGLREPNRYGDWPLNNEDPTQLLVTPGNDPSIPYQYDYWDHVDYVVSKAAEKGMYVGLLPTWGDKVAHLWGDGPIVFNEANAEVYAAMLAKRYAKQWNVIWILGGDRPALYKGNDNKEYDDRGVWRAMARGIESVLTANAFIAYHPWGNSYSTSQFFPDEAWLDIHAFQSGHGSRETEAWKWTTRDLAVKPAKPVVDMEPCYEDHPVNPWDGKWTRARGYFTAYDVRARVYRTVFAGAAGITYGHHQIWQFLNESLYPPINPGDTIIGWRKALRSEAAWQMKHLKNLVLSRPVAGRVPAEKLIRSSAGSSYVDLVYACVGGDRKYAFVYLPQNKPVTIDLSLVTGARKIAWWFDPRTGEATLIPAVTGRGRRVFTPPSKGKDWVLVIDDASAKFSAPGGSPP
jgi:hypothetical protein